MIKIKKLALTLAFVAPACLSLAFCVPGSSAPVAPKASQNSGPIARKRSDNLGTRRTLRFLVMGDWGTGDQHQKDVAEAMARHAQRQKERGLAQREAIDFVVLTGDNFYERGVTGVSDPLWQERFETMYDPIRLPMPFIAVLGNHDWGRDPLAQIQYSASRPPMLTDRKAKSSERPEMIPGTRWEMDGFYFKRSFGQVGEGDKATALADFFFIDTDLWTLKLGALADKQMAWLQDGLKNSRASWQFVVAHHPLYSDGEHGREAEILALREKLSPIFAKAGVDVFLCGHDHDLQHIEVPNHPTSFILSGAGGKLRSRATTDWGPFYASTPGFVSITLAPDEMQGQVIDSKGQALHIWRRAPAPPQP